MSRRAYIVGQTRFRVNTKEGTKRFGHVGTLAGSHWSDSGRFFTLDFEERSGTHRERFNANDLQRVHMTTPKED